tara:strand:- start:230 stop:442 length:213 start_codon:yes stop_codon:yes gene_type:complete
MRESKRLEQEGKRIKDMKRKRLRWLKRLDQEGKRINDMKSKEIETVKEIGPGREERKSYGYEEKEIERQR